MYTHIPGMSDHIAWGQLLLTLWDLSEKVPE